VEHKRQNHNANSAAVTQGKPTRMKKTCGKTTCICPVCKQGQVFAAGADAITPRRFKRWLRSALREHLTLGEILIGFNSFLGFYPNLRTSGNIIRSFN
jgi:hypothetical protein